ncbi:hypothetical protein WOLCODRAFT_162165 [Wolfiporia cocos MD-104 SS10]|uniref:Uncharacterized protein n=1 Tax=Wolfiporia cocos (strain MD-104) TaxID=742152 RepID=A0A2H3JD63_WOLCO|nr:hypothetical protein WOLCODRAFT_162165 [Wolfiporia cocos MD-104 SS10]
MPHAAPEPATLTLARGDGREPAQDQATLPAAQTRIAAGLMPCRALRSRASPQQQNKRDIPVQALCIYAWTDHARGVSPIQDRAAVGVAARRLALPRIAVPRAPHNAVWGGKGPRGRSLSASSLGRRDGDGTWGLATKIRAPARGILSPPSHLWCPIPSAARSYGDLHAGSGRWGGACTQSANWQQAGYGEGCWAAGLPWRGANGMSRRPEQNAGQTREGPVKDPGLPSCGAAPFPRSDGRTPAANGCRACRAKASFKTCYLRTKTYKREGANPGGVNGPHMRALRLAARRGVGCANAAPSQEKRASAAVTPARARPLAIASHLDLLTIGASPRDHECTPILRPPAPLKRHRRAGYGVWGSARPARRGSPFIGRRPPRSFRRRAHTTNGCQPCILAAGAASVTDTHTPAAHVDAGKPAAGAHSSRARHAAQEYHRCAAPRGVIGDGARLACVPSCHRRISRVPAPIARQWRGLATRRSSSARGHRHPDAHRDVGPCDRRRARSWVGGWVASDWRDEARGDQAQVQRPSACPCTPSAHRTCPANARRAPPAPGPAQPVTRPRRDGETQGYIGRGRTPVTSHTSPSANEHHANPASSTARALQRVLRARTIELDFAGAVICAAASRAEQDTTRRGQLTASRLRRAAARTSAVGHRLLSPHVRRRAFELNWGRGVRAPGRRLLDVGIRRGQKTVSGHAERAYNPPIHSKPPHALCRTRSPMNRGRGAIVIERGVGARRRWAGYGLNIPARDTGILRADDLGLHEAHGDQTTQLRAFSRGSLAQRLPPSGTAALARATTNVRIRPHWDADVTRPGPGERPDEGRGDARRSTPSSAPSPHSRSRRHRCALRPGCAACLARISSRVCGQLPSAGEQRPSRARPIGSAPRPAGHARAAVTASPRDRTIADTPPAPCVSKDSGHPRWGGPGGDAGGRPPEPDARMSDGGDVRRGERTCERAIRGRRCMAYHDAARCSRRREMQMCVQRAAEQEQSTVTGSAPTSSDRAARIGWAGVEHAQMQEGRLEALAGDERSTFLAADPRAENIPRSTRAKNVPRTTRSIDIIVNPRAHASLEGARTPQPAPHGDEARIAHRPRGSLADDPGLPAAQHREHREQRCPAAPLRSPSRIPQGPRALAIYVRSCRLQRPGRCGAREPGSPGTADEGRWCLIAAAPWAGLVSLRAVAVRRQGRTGGHVECSLALARRRTRTRRDRQGRRGVACDGERTQAPRISESQRRGAPASLASRGCRRQCAPDPLAWSVRRGTRPAHACAARGPGRGASGTDKAAAPRLAACNVMAARRAFLPCPPAYLHLRPSSPSGPRAAKPRCPTPIGHAQSPRGLGPATQQASGLVREECNDGDGRAGAVCDLPSYHYPASAGANRRARAGLEPRAGRGKDVAAPALPRAPRPGPLRRSVRTANQRGGGAGSPEN